MTSRRRAGLVHQPDGQTTIEYLPLEEVRVNAWVVDVSSRVILAQTFYNPSDKPTGRAKYVFPLPANAAVCEFKLKLEDGSVIFGVVKEKEEAAFAFDTAVQQGKTAALVERVTDDIFTISIGSIPANTRVTAHLTFVMDLLNEALCDRVRLQLPMYIAERYGTPPAAIQDASAADSHTRLHINVDIQTSGVIHEDPKSPTHAIVIRRYHGRSGQQSQRRVSADWKSSEFLASDFVVVIHAEGLDEPRCFAEAYSGGRSGGSGEVSTVAMQLTLVPRFQTRKVPSQEYIFIIDRSGSMTNNIETAKRTLSMLLRLLPPAQTKFNIFSFGTSVTGLWKCSRELDQRSLVEATVHVATMSANYGGTETPKALKFALESRGLDRPAVVFLLTDGQIYGSEKLDPWTVVSVAVQNSPSHAPVRLFVLGIGPAVSSDVCSRLARHGNGEYLFALSAEDILEKCARLLNAGRSKTIERIDVDWGHEASIPRAGPSRTNPDLPENIQTLAPPPLVQQAPHSLNKIFSGFRFTVFAIISTRAIPTSVKLITKLQGDVEPHELNVSVTKVKPFRDTNEQSSLPVIHTLAARKLIMELDERIGPLPTPAPEAALLVSEDDLWKAGMIVLGMKYQLVSKHTSFVAVHGADVRVPNERRRGGRTSQTRPRLAGADGGMQGDSPADAPTLLDGLIDGVISLFASVFGFGTANATSNPRSEGRPRIPGAYDGDDSGTSENDSGGRRGRSRGPSNPPAPTPSSRQRRGRSVSASSGRSTATFSSLSSLDGSSCRSSECWAAHSRSRSPLSLGSLRPRAPSPEFVRDTSTPMADPQTGQGNREQERRQERERARNAHALVLEMDVDGSFVESPLLTRLVGDGGAVFKRGRELGVNARVWATVVVVAYVRACLEGGTGESDLLELVTEKAREFVEGEVGGDDARTRGESSGRSLFERMVQEAGQLLRQATVEPAGS